MPNHFQLIPKNSNEPEKFSTIDDIMCTHFGVNSNDVEYYFDWYNVLGFALAMGLTFDELRNEFPEFLEIINYLDSNYTVKTWYSRN